jgi:hypothetical protein
LLARSRQRAGILFPPQCRAPDKRDCLRAVRPSGLTALFLTSRCRAGSRLAAGDNTTLHRSAYAAWPLPLSWPEMPGIWPGPGRPRPWRRACYFLLSFEGDGLSVGWGRRNVVPAAVGFLSAFGFLASRLPRLRFLGNAVLPMLHRCRSRQPNCLETAVSRAGPVLTTEPTANTTELLASNQ